MVAVTIGQGDANPFAIEEEKELIVNNWTADAAAEMVHRGAGLVISRRRIGEIIGGVEPRTIPQLVQIAMEFDSSRTS